MLGILKSLESAPWAVGPAVPMTAPAAAHVWCAQVNDIIDNFDPQSILVSDEFERGARFRSQVDRDRFIGRRAALRLVLSRYLSRPPSDIHFERNRFGKPYVKEHALEFSASHSDGVAIIAISDQSVGVDIERVDPTRSERRIADRFFANEERTALNDLSDSDFPERFFACWTRKEAFVKAVGCGLSLDLDRFAVSVDPDSAALLRSDIEGWNPADVTITSLRMSGFALALAMHTPLKHIEQWSIAS